jgi:hypothetical protein
LTLVSKHLVTQLHTGLRDFSDVTKVENQLTLRKGDYLCAAAREN